MRYISTIFAASLLTLSLSACHSDNPNNNHLTEPATTQAHRHLVGSHTGTITASMMDITLDPITNAQVVIAEQDSTASVTLPALTYASMNMTLPAITVTGVKVTEQNSEYTIAPTTFAGTDGNKAYSGTLSGTCLNSQLTLNYSITYGRMPQPLTCVFVAPHAHK